jgi:hypothetical protein
MINAFISAQLSCCIQQFVIINSVIIINHPMVITNHPLVLLFLLRPLAISNSSCSYSNAHGSLLPYFQ